MISVLGLGLSFRAMEVGLIIIALLYLALSISAIVGLFRQSSVRR
jgi:hypothetical protein